MADLSAIIDEIHPSNEETGVILGDQISVLFDREMDETTVGIGNFILEGPSQDIQTGPDLLLSQVDHLSLVNDTDIFQIAGYKSLVKGTISYKRISLTTTSEVSTKDTVGTGNLYRTKAILTPDNSLRANTEYTVYLAGDESSTDSLDTGVKTTTVFDTEAGSGNTGTTKAKFTGGYIGPASSDTYRIEITTAGEPRTAKYKWYRDSAPSSVTTGVPTSQKPVLLDYGVSIEFPNGTYVAGDKFTVVVKKGTVFNGNYTWSFKTGSGTLMQAPASTATTIIGQQAVVADSGTIFDISTLSPTHRLVHVDPDLKEIVITFTNDIDASTVTAERVVVTGAPVDGNEDTLSTRDIQKNLTVDGNKLKIKIR